jgi:uncharacterized protein YfaQ (DUF2300 family)
MSIAWFFGELVMWHGKLIGGALLLCAGTFLLVSAAQSHEGDENSQGCHNDHRTGQYHCHTPKTAQPESVTITYCHLVRGQSNCGHTRDACAQLVLQNGGACEPQLGFIVQ